MTENLKRAILSHDVTARALHDAVREEYPVGQACLYTRSPRVGAKRVTVIGHGLETWIGVRNPETGASYMLRGDSSRLERVQ
jgi:hypothetical protein